MSIISGMLVLVTGNCGSTEIRDQSMFLFFLYLSIAFLWVGVLLRQAVLTGTHRGPPVALDLHPGSFVTIVERH